MHMAHSYEEIRNAVIDILLGTERVHYPPNQWEHLKLAVAEVLERRAGRPPGQRPTALPTLEAELARDVFWDLFRQGFITLGLNDSNPQWPFFRLSHFGETTLQEGREFHFTDTSSYLAMVQEYVPMIDDLSAMYLDEAARAFHAGCMLSSCVMLGVASERRFDLMIAAGSKSPTHAKAFMAIAQEWTVLQRIKKFRRFVQPLEKNLPKDVREDLDTYVATIQAVIRTHRNEAGHPTGETKSREQVYVLLQMFAPYARKLAQLGDHFSAA
jgi:hypothetical protein